MTREEFIKMRIADLKKEIERLELSLNPIEEATIPRKIREYADLLKKELFDVVRSRPNNNEWTIAKNDFMISDVQKVEEGFKLAEREILADGWRVAYSTKRQREFDGTDHIITIREQ